MLETQPRTLQTWILT